MSEPGKKYDAGKAPLFQGLLAYFPNALTAIANVSAYGARKYSVDYSDKNWQRLEGASERYRDALVRHLLSDVSEPIDRESGLLHAAHMAWCALAYLELMHEQSEP